MPAAQVSADQFSAAGMGATWQGLEGDEVALWIC